MATSEQDEDSSWGDGAAQLPLVLAEGLLSVAPQLAGNILCGVVAGLQWEHKKNISIWIPGLLQKSSGSHPREIEQTSAFFYTCDSDNTALQPI